MPHIQVLGAFTSPFTRKIRVALGEKNLPFDYTGARTGGQAPFNPLGLVPVMIVDEKDVFFDSVVIIDYLELIAPSPALLPPPGLDQIMVKRWEALADGICDAGGLCMKEKRRGEKQIPEMVEKLTRRFERGIEALSNELGDNEWCHGNAFSLADIAVGAAFAWMIFRNPDRADDWTQRYANLCRLHERLMQRPAFASTVIPGAPIIGRA